MTAPPLITDVEHFAAQRRRLVSRIRETTGIDDARILGAFLDVPRHAFVNPAQLSVAYDDRALPLDEAQTISQPSMVAIMLQELALEPEHRVLEVGAGSGYAAALLSRLVHSVDSIEIRPRLAERARRILEGLGFANVRIHVADGRRGMPELAPFDRILVSAAGESIPTTLTDQMALSGLLAMPTGSGHEQHLDIASRTDAGTLEVRRSVPCVFVPLVGDEAI
jgi:protein-L-isoaspartate(D-aspartate) O-methyltransferase